VATKDDLKNGLKQLENDLKVFFLYLVAGVMGVYFVLPIISKGLGL